MNKKKLFRSKSETTVRKARQSKREQNLLNRKRRIQNVINKLLRGAWMKWEIDCVIYPETRQWWLLLFSGSSNTYSRYFRSERREWKYVIIYCWSVYYCVRMKRSRNELFSSKNVYILFKFKTLRYNVISISYMVSKMRTRLRTIKLAIRWTYQNTYGEIKSTVAWEHGANEMK